MKRSVIQYGLLIGLAASCCCAAAAEPVRVDVGMVDYRFSPDHLSLEHGIHYRLHLENRGKEIHEFTAPTFRSRRAARRKQRRLFHARRAGRYDLRCGDHDWAGMVGGITVR